MRALLPVVLLATVFMPSPLWAQRLPFERSFDVSDGMTLDAATIRGTIDVSAGDADRIVVVGAVTVRVAWNVPANAADIAARIASQPPIEQAGHVVRVRPPSEAVDRRAVTVSYQVRVPPGTRVQIVSESGAITVSDVKGDTAVQTQSGTIALTRMGGQTSVTTGSGAVAIDGADGNVDVRTASSAFKGQGLAGDLRVRTSSGAVDAALSGRGGVDIETGSSAIEVAGAHGAVRAVTRSGRVTVAGLPSAAWDVSTGSGSVDMDLLNGAAATLELMTRSGSIAVDGPVEGAVTKRRITGTIGGGGPIVRATSGSGSIRVAVGNGS